MANFKTTIITQKGHALIAKLEAGTATSNFKKICTSDYDYSSLSNSQLEELTSIRDTKQTILPDKISVINKATVKVSGTLTNTELKTGYYIRTIALYAVDPDEGEILYSITPSTLSDFIPPNNGVTSSGVIIDLLTTVSNAENVSIDVDPNAIVSIQTFNDFKEEVNSHLNDIAQRATDLSINVKGLGFLAKGDGVTDDTSAIQNALSALVANGGGELFFPSGIYCLNPFTLPQNVIIRGAGQNVTTLKLNNNQDSDFITFDNSSYSGITNLTVNGNKSNNNYGSGISVKATTSTDASNLNLRLEHIQIAMCKEHGLKCDGPNSWVFTTRFIHIETCDGYGVYNTSTDNCFFMTDITTCKEGAVYNVGTNNKFIGGKWYINGDKTLTFDSNTLYSKGRRNQYIGIEIQESYGNGVVVENATDEQFNNILIDSTGHYNVANRQTALKFINSKRCKFEGVISNGDVTDSAKYQYQGISIDDNSSYINVDAEIDVDRIITPISIDKAKNVHISGNVMSIPSIKLYNAENQSFATGVYTTLNLAQSSDINRMTYNSTTGEITVLGNGVYSLNTSITFNTTESTIISLNVYKNGKLLEKLHYNSINQSYVINSNLVMKLNTNDTIRVDINPISADVTINGDNTSHLYLTQIK
ncbi:MAG: glycosyl hydrolase family 28-related protein [Clostridium perfringens]|nr:glycosyl hydrolase family 28-related protein [Clostridium butyricum]MDU5776235.1 glycosyl hydrolase family 28-related protein [Clostridium perfringens]